MHSLELAGWVKTAFSCHYGSALCYPSALHTGPRSRTHCCPAVRGPHVRRLYSCERCGEHGKEIFPSPSARGSACVFDAMLSRSAIDSGGTRLVPRGAAVPMLTLPGSHRAPVPVTVTMGSGEAGLPFAGLCPRWGIARWLRLASNCIALRAAPASSVVRVVSPVRPGVMHSAPGVIPASHCLTDSPSLGATGPSL